MGRSSLDIFTQITREVCAFCYRIISMGLYKSWDEAFDPYILCKDDKTFGFFYLSYTPNSTNNYWIGGFQIDKEYQGMGLGTQSLKRILEFIQEMNRQCEVISLTIEKSNNHARKLYEKLGFVNQDKENQDGEIIYKLKLK
ncbi:GNAT family N-acetyltransferase [Paenibacillus albiflavus]|uniref:GNAT family N-acetyltransferase n=1 Tax=Paenibacillus albiflavus TaxID=2545760 RepID=UPI001F2C4C66|nr:GNAT family N-acetyltransferase [Paenibacillus albiflavus]